MSLDFPTAEYCTACAVLLWPQLEHVYSANSYSGVAGPGAQRYVTGTTDVLLTAPNGVNYYRGDAQMKAARWTGSAVEVLAAATSSAALAMAGPARVTPYRDNPEYAFADRLRTLVTPGTFVLDLIGMRDRQVDVSLGLGPAPDDRSREICRRLERGFTLRGVRVGINTPFPALAPVTVTAFTQRELGASALQVGLAAWLRDPEGSPTMAKLALDVLRDALAPLTPAP